MKQIRTFQFRLPKGPHEAVLDDWGDLAGQVLRYLHVSLRRITQNAARVPEKDRAEFVRLANNALKTGTLQRFGITGRQYNGLLQQLMGQWESRRALAKLDVDRLHSAIDKKDVSLKNIEKKITRDKAAREALALKTAKALLTGKPKPLPTKTQAQAMLDEGKRKALRFALHQGKRKLASLCNDLFVAQTAMTPEAVPKIVFGGKDMLRKRARIHPNNKAALATWRTTWDAKRAAGFMVIGSADETAGNISCKMTLEGAGVVTLDLRLPDGLGQGKHLCIKTIRLPEFGHEEMRDAIIRNTKPGERIALTYRFVRDGDVKSDTYSTWRVCVTVSTELPEPKPFVNTLGVDVNVDCLAIALINADGNPIRQWSIPLLLRGKTSEQRAAIIGDAVAQVVALAQAHEAQIVLEALDFAKKKREISDANKRKMPSEKRYARLLSSFAYQQISTAIERRAQRYAIKTCRVNPAYTSLIGDVNYSRRYGLTRHGAAAVAIARRACGHSERVNYIHGLRKRRNALPAPVEARRHVWRQWAMVHRERTVSARQASQNGLAYPSGRGTSPDPSGRTLPVS